ncbi:MAG: hypothetical protein LBF88_10195, partial [Planctomycetaceae bacterium]|nr:hypothetical protein [Planctomycetaceae bacterium]
TAGFNKKFVAENDQVNNNGVNNTELPPSTITPTGKDTPDTLPQFTKKTYQELEQEFNDYLQNH